MEVVTERAVKLAFQCEGERRIVWNLLKNTDYYKDCSTPRTLKYLAAKSIMEKRMKTDYESFILISLVFHKPIRHRNFIRTFLGRRARVKFETQGLTGDPVTVTGAMRTDPHVMLVIFEQMLRTHIYSHVDVYLRRHLLEVRIDYGQLAEIPHRTSKHFDTYWAVRFAKLAFANNVPKVNLQFDGESMLLYSYMQRHISRMINTLPRKTLSEGWHDNVENKGHMVYCKVDSIEDRKMYEAQFYEETEYFDEEPEEYYLFI